MSRLDGVVVAESSLVMWASEISLVKGSWNFAVIVKSMTLPTLSYEYTLTEEL